MLCRPTVLTSRARDGPGQTWWKEKENKSTAKPFLAWYSEQHGRKHLFSTLRELRALGRGDWNHVES
eukprot:3858212-Rhodomonas_salina.2